ncbi:hypothetical protein TNCT_397261 [Trichonephila clavata]|uniref:Uncharacterized protein n=1 Tax=Trichonephila clavata TaxID=2740835 RepID=A0A8X6GKA4_TRICU|nr:hypothetical protein TNCT_397261 [Trichonephila clavata]
MMTKHFHTSLLRLETIKCVPKLQVITRMKRIPSPLSPKPSFPSLAKTFKHHFTLNLTTVPIIPTFGVDGEPSTIAKRSHSLATTAFHSPW